VYDDYLVPKLYVKTQYCIACAIHAHIGKACSCVGS
jgi:ribosomal protein S26